MIKEEEERKTTQRPHGRGKRTWKQSVGKQTPKTIRTNTFLFGKHIILSGRLFIPAHNNNSWGREERQRERNKRKEGRTNKRKIKKTKTKKWNKDNR